LTCRFLPRLKSWWSQPDQFDWVTTFLRQRDLIRPAQVILAIVSASAVWVPLTVLATQHRPSATSAIIGVLIVVFALGSVAFWLTRWPTRRQSRIAAMAGMLSTGGWSIVQPSATCAALACAALVVTGGYIALFHSPRLLLLNGVVVASIGTAGAELQRLCTSDGGDLVEGLVVLADNAMYAAKRRGGNQALQSTGT
jgi:diguanylate cyclase